MDRLLLAWQEAVFSLYLSEGKIEPEVVENMRSWDGHRRAAMVDGFSVDQSVLLSAGDQAGIERLVQYMVRCPFSLSRLVKVTDYEVRGLARGVLSFFHNFQILPLELPLLVSFEGAGWAIPRRQTI